MSHKFSPWGALHQVLCRTRCTRRAVVVTGGRSVYVYMIMRVCVCLYMCLCLCVCVCVSVYVYMCMYECVRVCVHVSCVHFSLCMQVHCPLLSVCMCVHDQSHCFWAVWVHVLRWVPTLRALRKNLVASTPLLVRRLHNG